MVPAAPWPRGKVTHALPLDSPFRGHGGAVSGPQRRRFIFPGGGLEAHFRVPVLPAGKVGQKKGDGTPCRFLNACCFRCQQHPVPHLWPWSTSETGRLKKNSVFPGHYDRPGKFPIFREDSQFKLYLQGSLYTNHMERLAEGRTVAY